MRLLLPLLFLGASAHALAQDRDQEAAFDAQLYRPTLPGEPLLWTTRGSADPNHSWGARAVLHHALRPLLREADDTQTAVVSAIQHPDYAVAPFLVSDIAVARLAEAPPGVTPVPLNPISPESALWRFESVTHVGWGADADDGSGAGIKRETSLNVEAYDEEFVYTYADDGRNVCVGDSGGAALGRSESGEWVLVGVNAFVFDPEGGAPTCEGGAAGSTRVDAHRAFVEAVIEEGDEASAAGWSDLEDDGKDASGSIIENKDPVGCSAASGLGIGLWWLGLVVVRSRRRRD